LQENQALQQCEEIVYIVILYLNPDAFTEVKIYMASCNFIDGYSVSGEHTVSIFRLEVY
jgi:hypothetical protein